MIETLKRQKEQLSNINFSDYTKNLSMNELSTLEDVISKNLVILNNLKSAIKSKKVVKKSKITASYIAERISCWTEDCGGYTGEDFKRFCREFKQMMKKELSLIDATDYVQSNGHYYISGFFTKNNQPYYFSISDVRHFSDTEMLIRTAKDYKDYTGGRNTFVKIYNNMFVDYFEE